jgi:hypothetical protein
MHNVTPEDVQQQKRFKDTIDGEYPYQDLLTDEKEFLRKAKLFVKETGDVNG